MVFKLFIAICLACIMCELNIIKAVLESVFEREDK